MGFKRLTITGLLGLLLLALVPASPAEASGFGIFEQGNKALGMSNAFTAQADDPSAIFFNLGGLGFLEEREFMAGTTLILAGDSEFQGAAPFPGPGATAEQATNLVTPIHLYYVEPLNDEVVFGLGLNTPFGLVTEWDNKDTFPGRFLSEKAELHVFDLSANFGFKLGENVGFGVGLVYRVAELELNRRAGQLNPFTSQVDDVAHVRLSSDVDGAVGWNVGFLHKATENFSWGVSYRAKVEIDFNGDGRLTQIPTGFPQFDGLIAASLPFDTDLPISTSIEFPDMASIGFAYEFTPAILFEGDINWAGWETFDRTDINFLTAPGLNFSIVSNWGNSYNYRFGLRWTRDVGEWRFGVYFDETPQPEESVGPLLPDADRTGVSFGYGRDFGKLSTDFAFMYIDFDERTTLTNNDGFFGTYDSQTWLLGATLGF